MKVKELIAQLQEHDPELEVFGYNGLDEGGGIVWKTHKREGEFHYCKGDAPEVGNDPYIVVYVE
jgi:hypothetical protein